MKRSFKASLVALAISGAFANATYANEVNNNDSQQAVVKDAQSIEEITVVAKKTAYANNVADQTMVEQQTTISSVLAVMDNLPGISINEGDAFGGDDWSTSITMRGFTIDGNQQQLGMTIDGIPNGGSNYGGGAKANRYLDSENMATVEVAQGTSDIASASLEALGGNFNFVSLAPSEQQQMNAAYTRGSFNSSRYFMRYETGRIFDGSTVSAFSYSKTNTDRWVGEGSNGGADRTHAMVKFVSDMGDLQLTGRISYDDVEEDNYNSVSIEQFNQDPNWDQLTWQWTGIPHFDQMFAEGWSTLRTNTLAYAKFDYQFDGLQNLVVTPYVHNNTGRGDWIPPYLVNATDENGNPTDHGGTLTKYGFTDAQGNALTPAEGCSANYSWPWDSGSLLHPDCYPADAVPVMSYRHTHYQKNRKGMLVDYQASFGMHDIRVGAWFEKQVRNEYRDWHKVKDAREYWYFDQTAYYTQYRNKFTTDTQKWYAQDTMSYDAFTFNFGVKKYLVDVEKFDKFANQVTGKVNSDSDVLFSGGAQYQLTDEIELFAGYGENFAAIKDGVLERDASSLAEIKPETARNTDLGLRYRSDNLNISATAYNIKFDNRITFIAPGSDTSGIDYTIGTNGSYLNVGGIKSKGLELSAQYNLTDNWQWYASYTKNDSTYVGNAPGIEQGAKVADSVDTMWVLSTSYYLDSFSFGSSAKYTGERGDAPSYTVVDMNVGYSYLINDSMVKSLDFALVVNNLFDKDYLSSGTGNGKTFFIGAPRTLALTMTASF